MLRSLLAASGGRTVDEEFWIVEETRMDVTVYTLVVVVHNACRTVAFYSQGNEKAT